MSFAPNLQASLAAARDALIWLTLTVVLGSYASRILAEGGPGGDAGDEGQHARMRQRLGCLQQADDQKLAAGPEREAFLENCMRGSADEAAPPRS
jgi:hypothetical protein